MIEYLHKTLGICSFWFLMGPVDNYESQMRTQGLRDYCEKNGLPCGRERFYAESYAIESGIHGFDNLDIAAYMSPSLTTVDQLRHTMGGACIGLMERIWRGEDAPERSLNILIRCSPVRFGGDEFLIVTPAESREEVTELIEAILRSIAEEADKRSFPDVPGVSTGFVLTDPEERLTLNDYVEEADRLMYNDKRSRKSGR
ncbi:MAG TPA: hypothetical protein DCL38_05070 [Lachnospiraceae bacterium]|nr:hypothetical protein [Lachnospiraceae bacterium]